MTAQIHENLIIDGKMTSMAFCPPLPDDHPRICKVDLYDDRNKILWSTACWRNYQGTWEIKDSRFYLVELRGRFQLRDGTPILADWFSGLLRVPKGRELLYVHMGFGTVYEQEIHIKVEKGIVVNTQIIDNRGKEHDKEEIAWRNLPGSENRFPGNDDV